MTLLDDATSYADRNWLVHPCIPGDKRPATRWRDTATSEVFQITSWWQQDDFNIGVATGAESGIVVVDIDDLEAIPALRQQGELPNTLTARTPRGGLHLYFAHPGGQVPNSAGALAPGVDVRGDGGYVLSPGSVLPNGRYTWVEQRDLAPLPQWIVDASARKAPADGGTAPADAGETSRWGATVLERELAALMAAPDGQRNSTLYHCAMKVAGACKAGHLDRDHAVDQLRQVARRIGLADDPNCGPDGVDATIESAWQVAGSRGPSEELRPTGATGVPQQPEAPAETPGTGWLSVDDLFALPPLEWLIPGQLPAGLTMLFGAYGSGKSFVALDWSLALACGLVDGTARTVCYALGEGVTGFGSRVRAWTSHHEAQPGKGRFLARAGNDFPRLNDETSIAELCRDIERLPEPPDLLVVDTLARSLPGGEEGAREFSHAVAVCDDLRNRYGTSTLLVHHSGVNPDRERGHTSLGAACDAVWKLEAPDPEGGGRYHRLVNTKVKDGDRSPTMERRLDPVHGSALMRRTVAEQFRDWRAS